MMESIKERLCSPEGISYARKRLAEHLGEVERNREAQMTERRSRLGRIEKRIANLIDVLASGERSDAITAALRDMETHAATEKQALADLDRLATNPIRLPTPDEMLLRVNELEARLDQDPVAAREELRRYFDDGKIRLRVDENGRYVADWALKAGILLDDTNIAVPGVSGERRTYVGGSGGRI